MHEPVEIQCPDCGEPVTVWAPDPTLELAVSAPLDADLDAWTCPWCRKKHAQDSRQVLTFAMGGRRAADIREFLKVIQADAGTFPGECAHCDGAIMMRLVEFRPREPMRPGSWICPWCQRENNAEFAGRIEWVRRSTGNEEPSLD